MFCEGWLACTRLDWQGHRALKLRVFMLSMDLALRIRQLKPRTLRSHGQTCSGMKDRETLMTRTVERNKRSWEGVVQNAKRCT